MCGAVRFHADRVDAGVRSQAAGHVLQALEDVVVHRVERLGTSVSRHPQPFGHRVDRDHAPGAEQKRAADGELTDRTAAPDGDRVAGWMLQFSAAM